MRKRAFLLFVIPGIIAIIGIGYFIFANADTNISATPAEHFAWNDAIGWIDFYQTNTINVTNTKIEGYASSSFGEVSLDCATAPGGNICSESNGNYGVCNGPYARDGSGSCTSGDAQGELSGYAWNEKIGWISFNCLDLGVCGISNYKVSIDQSTGDFSGYAWNDLVGWISFNSGNPNHPSTPAYKVVTSWRSTSSVGYLESSIYDTQKTAGVLLNNIVWHGSNPASAGSCVSFQIAVSNSSNNNGNPWDYKGPSGNSSDYYGETCDTAPNGGIGCAPEGKPICVNKNQFINYRYLRYKIRLQTTPIQTSPEISDVILNWSP